jgi:hypothetical protein
VAVLVEHRAVQVGPPSLLGRKGGGRPGALGRQEPGCQEAALGLRVPRPRAARAGGQPETRVTGWWYVGSTP